MTRVAMRSSPISAAASASARSVISRASGRRGTSTNQGKRAWFMSRTEDSGNSPMGRASAARRGSSAKTAFIGQARTEGGGSAFRITGYRIEPERRNDIPGRGVFGQSAPAGAGLKRLSDEAMRSTPAAREPPRVLTEVIRFGTNPGNLRMFAFVPDRLPPSRPLVLVLHGCTQTAAGYDEGTGWSTLAERYGFALVFAQQKRANNLRTCFNWFQPEDVGRDRGEALSIRQMVEHMVERHRLGRGQAYVTGLSAGGAMTMVMLAAYPDVFAGGAVIAGLPYGCVGNAREALACMFQGCARSAEDWGDRVRAAAGRRGPWPKLSVWHGTADMTVAPLNAQEIVKQWTNVHGLGAEPDAVETV